MAPIVSPEHEHAKRLQILEAAEQCFTQSGYSATRISDIAKAAGIGKGTIYEYWRSKEALLADTCLHACTRSESRMAALIGDTAPNSSEPIDLTQIAHQAGLHPVAAAHGVLHSVLSVLLNQSREEQQLFSELATVALVHPELISEVRTQMQAKYTAWIRQAEALYQAGHEAGFFGDLPQSIDCSQLIVAAVDGLVWQRVWVENEDAENAARRMADAWIRLLLTEPQRLEEFLT